MWQRTGPSSNSWLEVGRSSAPPAVTFNQKVRPKARLARGRACSEWRDRVTLPGSYERSRQRTRRHPWPKDVARPHCDLGFGRVRRTGG